MFFSDKFVHCVLQQRFLPCSSSPVISLGFAYNKNKRENYISHA